MVWQAAAKAGEELLQQGQKSSCLSLHCRNKTKNLLTGDQWTVVEMLFTSKNDDNADKCLPGVLVAKQKVGDNGDHDKLQGSQARQHHLGRKSHGSKAQQIANAKHAPAKGHA